MTELSWEAIKRYVYERAGACCEYCRTSEANIGQAMHVEHINPNGSNDLANLCLSCPNCNLSKATATTAIDPISLKSVPLYNPRTENWSSHFTWSDHYTKVEGITAVGRATVARLKMNRLRVILARERWVQAGFHPPEDENRC